MTRTRFLVAATQRQDALDAIRAFVLTSERRETGIRPVLARNGLLVLATDASPLTAGGVLLGQCFMRSSEKPVETLSEAEQRAILASRGEWLIRACWGDYVAIFAQDGPSSLTILRAPLGGTPCYVLQDEDVFLCASDVDLLVATGCFKPAIEPAAVVRQLTADDIRRPETCLRGLTELSGGSRLSLRRGQITKTSLWSPWDFADESRQIPDREEALRHIRDAADHCVAARSAAHQPILLKLSGGLDSSIVAACLRHANRQFTCLTMVTSDAAGDERHYAALAARASAARLIDRFRDVSHVDVRRSEAWRLPRPTARSFTQASSRLAAEAAQAIGATTIFDGGGGDNVFCSLQSARPAADCLLSAAGRGHFWTTARSIARLSQATLGEVAWRAAAIMLRRRQDYRRPIDTRFLSREAIGECRGAIAHPWLSSLPGILPGKAAHVALVAAAQSIAEGFDVQAELATQSPLISQPLVEACLQVPSWLWFDNGRNRATARAAFADALPEAVINRRSKGAPDSFVAEIYEANRSALRDMLMGGWLRSEGLIDTKRLAAELDDPAPVRNHQFLRIMQLADVEAWVRAWR